MVLEIPICIIVALLINAISIYLKKDLLHAKMILRMLTVDFIYEQKIIRDFLKQLQQL